MLQVRYRYVQNVFQLPGNCEVLEYTFRLSTEVAIKAQSSGGINVRHFKVALQNIDNAFVNRLEKDKEVLDQYSKCGYGEFVFEIVQIELAIQQRVDRLLDDLGLPQQTLIHSHDPQLPPYNRLASRHQAWVRSPTGRSQAIPPRILRRHIPSPQIPIVLRLHSNWVVFEVTVRSNPVVEIQGIFRKVLGRCITFPLPISNIP